jgi:20S proteasome alpha/beta subunit
VEKQIIHIKKKELNEAEKLHILKTLAPHKMMVGAKQMEQPFSVTDKNGDTVNGKAGDYLVKHSSGELAIYEKENFEENFSFAQA